MRRQRSERIRCTGTRPEKDAAGVHQGNEDVAEKKIEEEAAVVVEAEAGTRAEVEVEVAVEVTVVAEKVRRR